MKGKETSDVYLRFRKRHKAFQSRYEKIEAMGSMILMVVITLINGAEIFSRYVIGRSIYWVQEMTLFLAIWMVFLGAGVLFKRKEDIVISLLTDRLSRFAQYLIFLFLNILTLVFLVFLITSSVKLELHQRHFGSIGLHIPMNLFYMPISLGSISIFITVVDWILDAVEERKGILPSNRKEKS